MRPGHLTVCLPLLVAALPGVVWSTADQTPRAESIREVLTDRDEDRVPDRIGEIVTVEGVIISTPLVLNPEASLVNFQDSTAGIVLFTRDTTVLRTLARGDSVRVRGRLGQYRGAEQLLVEDVESLGRGTVPDPVDVLVEDIQGEEYFGRLVRVAGTLTARETEAGWMDVQLRDRTGSVPVYISSRFLTDAAFVQRLHRGGEVEVVGIASQDTPANPPAGGYRLVPRDTTDLAFPTALPWGLVLAGVMTVLGLTALWWQRRERHRARQLERLTGELQRSKEALQVREERFRSLVENAADTMSILGPGGRVLYQSRSVRRMLGWEAEDLEGRDAFELIHPEEREEVRSVLGSLAADPGGTAEVEFRIQAKDGSWHRVEVTGTNRLHDPAVGGIVCNTRDVTQHKILEQLVRNADRMEAVGRLAGGIAHDFNNVLTALRGHAELALETIESDEHLRHELEEIIRGADRATGLTRQLLAFARERVTQPDVIAPSDVLENMVPMLTRLIGEDVELVARVTPDVGGVRVDPVQLEQVIMNLAVNARDAMPDGGRMEVEMAEDRITPEIAAEYPYQVRPGEYVRLSVTDTGRGMEDEVLSHVFDPFFTTKEPGQGTGLGMATLYGIVKQSDGYVWGRSEVGRGSRFDVYLPRVDGVAQDARPEARSRAPGQGRGETILLVEDEDGVRELARRVLEKNGYEVLSAEGPEVALALAREHGDRIDLLFTDVVMPGMSGGELADRLRAEHPELPTLFTSGYTEDEVVRRGVSAGEAAFLEKPFTPKALLREIQAVLDGRLATGSRP